MIDSGSVRVIAEIGSVHDGSLGNALKISTELVAAVLVGTIFGFILDCWFDTKPFITICFFFIGVAAGIKNVINSEKKMNKNMEK